MSEVTPYFITRIFIREDTCADGSVKIYHYPQYKRNTKWDRFFGWEDMSSLAIEDYRNSKNFKSYSKRKKADVKSFIDWWLGYQQNIRDNTVVSKKYSHEPYPD